MQRWPLAFTSRHPATLQPGTWTKETKMPTGKKQDKVPAHHPLLHRVPRSDKAFPTRWQSPGCLEHTAGKGQHRHHSRSYLLQQGAWAEGQAACQGFQCWKKEDVFTTQGVEGEFPLAAYGSLLHNNYKIRIIKKKHKTKNKKQNQTTQWFGLLFNFR